MGRKKPQMKVDQRRSGGLKKASEVCTWCAVETALVIFSPGGTFCRPCVEAAVKRLAYPKQADAIAAQHQAKHEANLQELSEQYAKALEELEAEKERGEKLEQVKQIELKHGTSLMEGPLDGLNLDELLVSVDVMEGLKKTLYERIKELSVRPADSTASSSTNIVEAINAFRASLPGSSASVDINDQGN